VSQVELSHFIEVSLGKSTVQFALQILWKVFQEPDAIFSLTVALLLGVPQFGRCLPNSMIGQLNIAGAGNIE